MTHHARATRRIASIAACAALVASGLAGTPAAVAASAAFVPADGMQPQFQKVGRVGPDTQTFSCQTTTPAGCYGPAQIRAAYGVDRLAARGLDGSGQTIVIIDAFQSPTVRNDLATFDSLFGLPDPTLNVIAPDGITPFDQNNADQVGWAGEITLDVEYAHAIAPGATIDLVLAKSDNDADILSAQQYAVSHNLGSVISQSFGEAEQCAAPSILSAEHRLFAEAVARHITVLASSGDLGSGQYNCDGSSYVKAVSTPASDPFVTAVGGTTLDADGVTGAYHSETAWNEPDFGSATGGGFSTLYGEPSYQRTTQRTGARGVPDVAYNAAIIGGVLVVWSSSGLGSNLVFRFGGTSAGSPQWAGIVALTDQLRGSRVGFLNPALYRLAVAPRSYRSDFHDVTTGDNADPVTGVSGYSASAGWDPATGLGSPMAQNLVPTLARTA